jgi:hypothetical protein
VRAVENDKSKRVEGGGEGVSDRELSRSAKGFVVRGAHPQVRATESTKSKDLRGDGPALFARPIPPIIRRASQESNLAGLGGPNPSPAKRTSPSVDGVIPHSQDLEKNHKGMEPPALKPRQ